MSEQERRQTTKGIWMSKNKKEGVRDREGKGMAEKYFGHGCRGD